MQSSDSLPPIDVVIDVSNLDIEVVAEAIPPTFDPPLDIDMGIGPIPLGHPLMTPNVWGTLRVEKIIQAYIPDAKFEIINAFYQEMYEEQPDGSKVQTSGIVWHKGNTSPKPTLHQIYQWSQEILLRLYDSPPDLSGFRRNLIYLAEYRAIINALDVAIGVQLALLWFTVTNIRTLLRTINEWNGLISDRTLIPDSSVIEAQVTGLQGAALAFQLPLQFQSDGTIQLETKLKDTITFYRGYDV
jgi:hypothetical protein